MASLLKFTKYVGSFSRSYLQQTACRSLSTTQKLRLDTRDNYDGYIQDKIQEGKVAVEDEPEQIQVPDHLGFTMDNAHQYLLAEEFHPEADEVLDMQVDQIWDMPIDHGTRDRPILVPSRADHRVIGCICDEEDFDMMYTMVFEDCPTRCECGYWFRLIRYENPRAAMMSTEILEPDGTKKIK